MRLIKSVYHFYFHHPVMFGTLGWIDANGIKGYNNDAGEHVGYSEYGKDKVYYI